MITCLQVAQAAFVIDIANIENRITEAQHRELDRAVLAFAWLPEVSLAYRNLRRNWTRLTT